HIRCSPMLLPAPAFFCFHCNSVHRDLHSFPTRRSSDLRCGRSRHLARKLSLRRKRSSPNVFEMAATETITSIILKTFGLLRFLRSEERFSRNAETDLVCRLLLEKQKHDVVSVYGKPNEQ